MFPFSLEAFQVAFHGFAFVMFCKAEVLMFGCIERGPFLIGPMRPSVFVPGRGATCIPSGEMEAQSGKGMWGQSSFESRSS